MKPIAEYRGRGHVLREKVYLGPVDYFLEVVQEDLSFETREGITEVLGPRFINGVLSNWEFDLDQSLVDPDETLTLELDNHVIGIDFRLENRAEGWVEVIGDFYKNRGVWRVL